MSQEDSAKAQIALAWKLLYNEPYDFLPDPNNEADTAAWNMMKKQRVEALDRFLNGPGKPLIEQWHRKIKGANLNLLFSADIYECTCKICLALRDIRNILLLMFEMQQTIDIK